MTQFTNRNTVVLFDLSGVFFNEGLSVAVKEIRRKYGIESSKVEHVLNGAFAKEYRTGLIEPEDFWQRASSELKVNNIGELAQIFFNSYYPNKETADLLARLRKAGIKTAYLSNSPKDRAEYLDKKYGFLALFDFGLCSYEAHAWKPDIEFFEAFLRKFRIKPGDAIYVEDREPHLKPARDLGMQVIQYKNTQQLERELNQHGLRF